MISPRTAELALVALDVALRRAQPKRNGLPVPDDWRTAVAELRAASGTGLGGATVPVGHCEVVDVATAARRLGLSPTAVRKRCRAGTLAAVRIGRRTWSITLET